MAIYVIHRHRKHWPDPVRFDPDRFLEANASGRRRFAPDPAHRIYPQFSITLRPRGGMPLQVSPAGSRPC